MGVISCCSVDYLQEVLPHLSVEQEKDFPPIEPDVFPHLSVDVLKDFPPQDPDVFPHLSLLVEHIASAELVNEIIGNRLKVKTRITFFFIPKYYP